MNEVKLEVINDEDLNIIIDETTKVSSIKRYVHLFKSWLSSVKSLFKF
ncbi:MAG: hypothetical protein ACI4V7_03230 [Succinivibrionaceae bacterium]